MARELRVPKPPGRPRKIVNWLSVPGMAPYRTDAELRKLYKISKSSWFRLLNVEGHRDQLQAARDAGRLRLQAFDKLARLSNDRQVVAMRKLMRV
jgi:hypothetical protein